MNCCPFTLSRNTAVALNSTVCGAMNVLSRVVMLEVEHVSASLLGWKWSTTSRSCQSIMFMIHSSSKKKVPPRRKYRIAIWEERDATWMFSRSSYRFCGRGGGGGLLDVWHVTTKRSSWCWPQLLHTLICWSSPPRQNPFSSLKMTPSYSESLHDNLARHHCSLGDWCGVKGNRHNSLCARPESWSHLPMVLALPGWLMEGTPASFTWAIMAVKSVWYSDKACPYVTCMAKRETC